MLGVCSCVCGIVITIGVEASGLGGLRVEWQCTGIGMHSCAFPFEHWYLTLHR